jgi:hypothetical protein
VTVRQLVNGADAIKKILQTRKIQMQVTAVARPRNHEDPTNTAILLDGGFLLWSMPAVLFFFVPSLYQTGAEDM